MTQTPTRSQAADSFDLVQQERGTFNFSAGPGCIPEPVIKRAQADLFDLFGTGIGILEHSHRGEAFDRVLHEAIADCRAVGDIPDNYHVLFLQGGATTQCWQVPANFLAEGRTADYFDTGKWASDSIKGAAGYGEAHVAGSSKTDKYSYIPTGEQVSHSDNPAYVHFTSNNTIMGTSFPALPQTPGESFLVCDASSDIYSRPIDITKYGLLYAGGQKNLGPAGTVLVMVRDDVLQERTVRDLHPMMSYKTQAAKESRYNTPPTFGIYLMGQTFKWILEQGGLETIEKHNVAKAKIIYDVLDSVDFYKPHVREPQHRSLMNATFTTPSAELDTKFVTEAKAAGLDGLAGHRSIGGMRASMYNAFPRAGCEAMAQFMRDFAARNG